MAKRKPGPDTTSAAYDEMLPTWHKLDSLMAGTGAMRSAGQVYLPKHEEESDSAYDERLARATLLNMLDMTVNAWVGKPFSDPVKVGEDVPEQLKTLMSNIDMQGNNIDVFARNWFKDGLAKGLSHVLVEFPRPAPREDGLPRTLDDDRRENLRPYLVHVKPENLYFANARFENGVEVLSEVRIRETIVEVVGWEEQVVTQLRIIRPGVVSIYREVKETNSKKVVWKLVESYPYDLPYVPVITFYADRQGFMTAKPPLNDLADLNIAHWQSSSDQTAVLTVARFPVLGVSGAISDDHLRIGPHAWLHCPDPAGRFYYVEHSGKAIGVGRQHLLDLEEVMAEYGATFLKKRPGGASATARALDTAEVTSPLEDMAIRFQSALQRAMIVLGAWVGLKEEEVGTFGVNTDFDYNSGSDSTLTALQSARETKDISRTTYLKELHRLGVLAEDFDAKVNEAALKVELAAEQAREDALLVNTAKATAAARPAPSAAPKPAGGGAKE